MSKPDSFGIIAEAKATWWAQASPGTTYWRCEVPARRLPGQVLQLQVKDIQRNGNDYVYPRQEGAAIWQFPGNTGRALMMAGMQQAGIPVFVEVDDNYLIPLDAQETTQWGIKIDRYNLDKVSREAHRRIIPWTDGVIVATEELARHYRKANPNTFVCPNSIEVDDWPEPEKPDDGVLRIGYAASASHRWDIRLLEDAFHWASRQDGVEVVLFGLAPKTGYWAGINPTVVPWTDTLADYRRSLQILDVGCCPLRETAWSRCKSDLKAMEYAMAGAMSIVSRVEPYQPWFDKPCLIAEREKDWKKLVQWCVSNRDEVKQLAREAKDYVLKERTIEQNLWHWEEALECVPALL